MFKGDKCYGKNIKWEKGMRSVRLGKSAAISSVVFRETLTLVNNLKYLNHSSGSS